jgi:alpha-tubulin suppressor-like RCC1 family protein
LYSRTPLTVAGLSGIVEIAAGSRTSAARDGEGHLFMWGGNETGALGDGSREDAFTPALVPLAHVSAVATGGDLGENDHTLALVEGQVYGWGYNRSGDIGDETTINRDKPVATQIQATAIAASGVASFVVKEGAVYGFGSNWGDALGSTGGRTLRPRLIETGVSMISTTANDVLVF